MQPPASVPACRHMVYLLPRLSRAGGRASTINQHHSKWMPTHTCCYCCYCCCCSDSFNQLAYPAFPFLRCLRRMSNPTLACEDLICPSLWASTIALGKIASTRNCVGQVNGGEVGVCRPNRQDDAPTRPLLVQTATLFDLHLRLDIGDKSLLADSCLNGANSGQPCLATREVLRPSVSTVFDTSLLWTSRISRVVGKSLRFVNALVDL
ncbi:hypothetical protein PV04_08094 [Phialophora macrospora]|uniref:Uncharacterized protein n=1 Tax=Phialophora macrospora TaxID=1851006 RepID=A0A0D2FCY6_9EURO|nr:hypothetical protein PV04_08094 [Phialophora macrospora]